MPLTGLASYRVDIIDVAGVRAECQRKLQQSAFEHLVVFHTARGQIGFPAVCQRCLGSGMLLGIVVFPFDADRSVKADAVEFDENLFQAVGIAAVPAVTKFQPLAQWPIGRCPPSLPARQCSRATHTPLT